MCRYIASFFKNTTHGTKQCSPNIIYSPFDVRPSADILKISVYLLHAKNTHSKIEHGYIRYCVTLLSQT